jgi:hypothetical protein
MALALQGRQILMLYDLTIVAAASSFKARAGFRLPRVVLTCQAWRLYRKRLIPVNVAGQILLDYDTYGDA